MSRRIGRLTRVAVACAAAVGLATALGVRAPDRADAAGGVVFAGLSGQKKPVIVQVNARRTRVVRVYWDWRATCSLGPAAPAGTPLTTAWSDMAERFAINARGRWSGSYSTGPFPNATTGVTQRFGYRLTGGLVRGRPDGRDDPGDLHGDLGRGPHPNLRLRAHQVQHPGLSTTLSRSAAPPLGGPPAAASPAGSSRRPCPTTRTRRRRDRRGGSPIQAQGSPRHPARG